MPVASASEWLVACVVAVVAAGAGLVVWRVPLRQARRWRSQGLGAKEVAELEGGSRSTLIQLFGGVALLLTFVATWVQLADTREASDATLRLASTQQESQRFREAVDELASPSLAARVGGIFALEQAARERVARRQTVSQLLLAYLKSRHPWTGKDERIGELLDRVRHSGMPTCASSVAPPELDTQAALAAVLRIPRGRGTQLDLSGMNLVGVRLNHAHFDGAFLRGSSLAGAKLTGAHFDRAYVPSGADLRGACLVGTHFAGAYIGNVMAEGADFSLADLSKAAVAPFALQRALTRCARMPAKRSVPSGCARP